MKKRIWIIDAAYMFMSGKKSLGAGFKFDYQKLRERLEQDGRFDIVYYVDAVAGRQSKGFYEWLKKEPPMGPGFTLKLYVCKSQEIKCPHCGKKIYRRIQKGVDVGIAALALTTVDTYDTLERWTPMVGQFWG